MMWKCPQVFSSGALFQARSVLTVNGITDSSVTVTGKIINDTGETLCTATAVSEPDGRFAVALDTPAASFVPCRIVLSGRDEDFIMEDVLFGELWLASGQSNMEMPNRVIPGAPELYDAVAGKMIRVYHVDYIADPLTNGFPWEPDNTVSGSWMTADEPDKLEGVSAVGLRFVNDLYDHLNRAGEVPVGFLNACWGGTRIHQWLPRDAVYADAYMLRRLEEFGLAPCPDTWNSDGSMDKLQQPSGMYNVKMAPLWGVRVRSMIWYQGESDCEDEPKRKIYADELRFYCRVCRERFSADPERFMMLSVLIYPWSYGQSGECHLGVLNQAFTDTALEAPDQFGYVPINDLAPVWSFSKRYHPIHPAHKYAVGARLARLAVAKVYGGAGQKAPATLRSCTPEGNRLVLRFDSIGTGLEVRGDRVRGLYVAGADGRYYPADAAVTEPDTLTVWCEAIPAPLHVAYGVQSMDCRCNLFAGEYPVTPFYTDRENPLTIEARPWYDTATNAVWVMTTVEDTYQDVFYRPVWQPMPGSMICEDTAFCQTSPASLRVCGDGDDLGCFVMSYRYNRLDMANYPGLSVDILNHTHMTAAVVLETDAGEQSFPLMKTAELQDGWARFEARFTDVAAGEIRRMSFRFHMSDTPYRFVNIERVRLL